VGAAAAFANGVLYIFDGPQPVNADAAATGNLLIKVTLASGAFTFGTSTNGLTLVSTAGVLSKDSGVWSGNGILAGTAGWWRLMGNPVDNLLSSTTLARMDGNIGVGGSDLNVGTVAVAVGAPFTIDTFQYTLPSN